MPAGGTSRRVPDISKLGTLGYKPTVSLDDGLKKYFEKL
jgi:nucleoside-diphosphate-sugar epimerase